MELGDIPVIQRNRGRPTKGTRTELAGEGAVKGKCMPVADRVSGTGPSERSG